MFASLQISKELFCRILFHHSNISDCNDMFTHQVSFLFDAIFYFIIQLVNTQTLIITLYNGGYNGGNPRWCLFSVVKTLAVVIVLQKTDTFESNYLGRQRTNGSFVFYKIISPIGDLHCAPFLFGV